MRNDSDNPFLVILVAVLALAALAGTVAVRREEVTIVVFLSLFFVYMLCLYCRKFTSLSSKKWMKRLDIILRCAVMISAVMMIVHLINPIN